MFMTTLRCNSRSNIAAAIIGSSLKTFPHGDPEVGRQSDAALQVPPAHNLEKCGGGLAGQRQVAHFVDDQEARPHVKTHGVRPPSLEGGAVAASREVGCGGVVGAHPRRQGGMAEPDGQHGLADTGRADQQTLVASSTKRSVASSSMSFLSTDGWAEKSKSASVNGEGSEAKRARLARRRSSTALTSTPSRRSKNPWWLSLALPAWSSSPGGLRPLRSCARKPDESAAFGIQSLRSCAHLDRAGEGQGDDLGQVFQVDAGLVTDVPDQAGPLGQRLSAGGPVGFAVTGPSGGELAEHHRF